MPDWITAYVFIYWIGLACVFVASLRWGDDALRLAASCYFAFIVLGQLGLRTAMYRAFEPIQAATDIAMLIALVMIALRHPRWWLMAASAFQMVASLGHFAKLLYHPSRLAYALMTGIGGYPILILLTIPAIQYFRNRRMSRCHPASGSRGDTRPR